jgi:hypothetical protein
MHDGSTRYDVHAPQFSQEELLEVLGESAFTINNWVAAGYLKPDYRKDPRGGRDRRRFSIMAMARAKIIASCVTDIWLRPSHAVEIADFAIPYLNEQFDRHPDGELVSKSLLFIVSRIEGNQVRSLPIYQRPNETAIYFGDPDRNPDVKQVRIDFTAIVIPASTIFNQVFLKAAELLAKQQRGGLDKFRRSIDVENTQ